MERPHTSRLKSNANASSWPIFTPTNSTEADEISKKIEEKLIKQLSEQTNESNHFDLSDVAPFINEGAEVLVEDEFTKCFTSIEPEAWNWNIYLYPMWLLGLCIRYGFLFPLRLCCLTMGTFLFAIAFIFVSTMMKGDVKQHYQRKCISFYCSIFVMSWSGVIKYHGVKPPRKKNQIFVANHTTVMDIVILQQHSTYAVVGQKHVGIMGFIQKYLLACIGCLWFNRSEAKDRLAVARMIKEHIQNEKSSPLLVFPEGVCVNNQYCVMFKKGAFELGAVVYPIAIKYNPLFADAFYNSKKQTFVRHLWNLMTCWAVVCDVWYMEPQTIRPNESPAQFANRVKAMIAKKAGIINVHWDGYLNPRFLETKQRVFAQNLVRRYTSNIDGTISPPYSPEPVPHENGKPKEEQMNGKALTPQEEYLNGKEQHGNTNKENEAPNKDIKENGMSKEAESSSNKEEEMSKKEPHMNGVHQRKVKMDSTEIER